MTDNEIIKALECCFSDKFGKCEECPLRKHLDEVFSCMRLKQKLAVDLINRQKAEIERLNGCVKSEEEVRAIMKSQMMPMVNEIVNEQFDVAVKLARAEAIKEFAERFKKRIAWRYTALLCERLNEIMDDIVKEMVGDVDGKIDS